MEIRQLRPRTYKLKKGQTVICRNGAAWITADGRDIILKTGDSYLAESAHDKAVICPLGTPEICLAIR